MHRRRLADHFISIDDLDLALFARAGHGFEARLFGMLDPDPGDVTLQTIHQKEEHENGDRPNDQDDQKEQLVESHRRQSAIR